MSKRKILIISHNPMSNVDNMGRTIKNIFSNFKKEELCQLYLRNQEPYFEGCQSFFCMNEVNVVKSIFLRMISTGKEITQNDFETKKDSDQNDFVESVYQYGRKRSQFIYMARNLCWSLGKWKSKNLIDWLKEQKPSCIFFFAGDYSFLFKIVINISKMFNIPVYSYYVDEYYFTKHKNSKFPIEAYLYKRNFRKLVNHSKMNFCISEKMQIKYSETFNKKIELLMNTTNSTHTNGQDFNKKVLEMNYLGNISYNRWKNLSDISTYIKKLNTENDKKINFTIYSGERNQELLNLLISNPDVNFGGRLTQEEVEEKIENSDILVHTESFDQEMIEKVEFSLSTKIPDSLASGKLFLIYGPEGIEPVDYLERNSAAYIIKSQSDLYEKLNYLYCINDFDNIISNAKSLVEKNHNSDKNYDLLNKYL